MTPRQVFTLIVKFLTWLSAGIVVTIGLDLFAEWSNQLLVTSMPTPGLIVCIILAGMLWLAATSKPDVDAQATWVAAQGLLPGTLGWLLGTLLVALLEVYQYRIILRMFGLSGGTYLLFVMLYRDDVRQQQQGQ